MRRRKVIAFILITISFFAFRFNKTIAYSPVGSTRVNAIVVKKDVLRDYTATTLREGVTWFEFRFPVGGTLTIEKTPDEINSDVNFYFDFYLGSSKTPFISRLDAHMLSDETTPFIKLFIDKCYEPVFIKVDVLNFSQYRKIYGLRFVYHVPKLMLKIGNQDALIDDMIYHMDVAPMIIFSRTEVPIRFVSEAFGAKVDWDNDKRMVTITMLDKKLQLWIGKKTAKLTVYTVRSSYVKYIKMDVAPVIINSRTFVPIRFVTEGLGGTVQWNDYNKTVTISFSNLFNN
ncbi:MAG: copper amine oxidase N-terminal domain-containing protein [Caldisericaceae bacterium]|nr:copper amine oxidase N-terminal domain-containing protein [Caldisericaceae bacterium]